MSTRTDAMTCLGWWSFVGEIQHVAHVIDGFYERIRLVFLSLGKLSFNASWKK
jgi:hypothetical protein